MKFKKRESKYSEMLTLFLKCILLISGQGEDAGTVCERKVPKGTGTVAFLSRATIVDEMYLSFLRTVESQRRLYEDKTCSTCPRTSITYSGCSANRAIEISLVGGGDGGGGRERRVIVAKH